MIDRGAELSVKRQREASGPEPDRRVLDQLHPDGARVSVPDAILDIFSRKVPAWRLSNTRSRPTSVSRRSRRLWRATAPLRSSTATRAQFTSEDWLVSAARISWEARG
jgi:transposase InsO family protein